MLRRPVLTKSRPFFRLFLDKKQLANYIRNFVCRLRITSMHRMGLETRVTYVMSASYDTKLNFKARKFRHINR